MLHPGLHFHSHMYTRPSILRDTLTIWITEKDDYGVSNKLVDGCTMSDGNI